VPLDPAANGGLELDLSGVRFAGPTLALRLAAADAVHSASGVPFTIVPPRSSRARAYLARTGLAARMGLEQPAQAADVLMPITRIDHSSGVEPAAEQLQKAAVALPGGLAQAAPALVLALSELGGNACIHGESDHGAFMLAQRFGRSRLVLAVGDLGVGIPAHLGEALHADRRTGEAGLIARALKPGVTGVRNGSPDENHGNGLPNLLETIRDLGMPEAELCIWSGVGRVSVRMRSQPVRPRLNDIGSFTRGTWIEVVLASSETGKP
jgi:hypothetical protein